MPVHTLKLVNLDIFSYVPNTSYTNIQRFPICTEVMLFVFRFLLTRMNPILKLSITEMRRECEDLENKFRHNIVLRRLLFFSKIGTSYM